MTYDVSIARTRTARVTHSGRNGITIDHLRQLVADADEAGIPRGTRVFFEDKPAGEGGNRSGYLEVTHREPPAVEHSTERPQPKEAPMPSRGR